VKHLGGLFLCLFVFAAGACGQGATASLTGTVRDASGAVVPVTKVTVTNVATGVAKETVTNQAGIYFVPDLISGTYTIVASANGFRRTEVSGVKLEIDQKADVDVALTVGSVSEEVTVTTAPPALQTEDASVGAVVQEATVQDMPLNGRSFTQLLVLVPGATSAVRTTGFTNSNPDLAGKERNGIPAFDINGANGEYTMFRLDGIENTEREFGGANIPISIDAIQEVKLQTNNFSAEYGRSSAQVDVVTKSGGNQFHGSLYEFLRNDYFDATQWTYNSVHRSSLLKRNQFGGTFGGPIKKDKLFFFFNYEGTREVFSVPQTTTVPSNLMRQGVFPAGVVIYDPSTGSPFPDNTIPMTRWNTISNKVVSQVLPAPNQPAQININKAGFQTDDTLNYVYNPRHIQDIDQFNIRGDYAFSPKNSFFARYTFSSNDITGYGPLATNIQSSLVGFEHDVLGGSNLSTGWVHSFSPTVVNQFTFGILTDPQQYNKGDTTDWPSKLGVTQDLLPNYLHGLPHFQIGSVNLGSGDYRPLVVGEWNFQFVDNLAIVRGKHTIKAGFDIRKTNLVTTNNEISTGRFYFNGAQTRDRAFPTVSTTYCPGTTTAPTACSGGDPMADFLLGDLSFFEAGSDIPALHKHFSNWAGYVTDTWKILPKLTLTLGLRYEYQTRWHADPAYYALPVMFDGEFTGKVAIAQNSDGSLSNAIVPTLAAQAPGSLVGCTAVGLPKNCLVSEKGDWAPRVGLAWQVLPKTVFRIGGGVFYGYLNGDADTEDGEGWPLVGQVITPTYTRPPAGLAPPPLNLSNTLGGATPPQPDLEGVASSPNRRVPSTYQWNAALERELTKNLNMSVTYVGRVARHLDDVEFAGASYGYYNIPQPWGVVLAPGQTQQQAFPRFSAVEVYEDKNTSSYNALQVRLEQRLRAGLTLTASYSYAQNLAVRNNLIDPRCPECSRGPSEGDLRNNFVFAPIWELPFGQGRQFLNSNGKLLDAFVGGWRLTGILTWRSGFPFSAALSGTDLLQLNGFHYEDLPNQVCNPQISNPSPLNWFNKNCFAAPVEPTTPGSKLVEGNEGFNSLRGPGGFSLDTGISKTFKVTERYKLDFRGELFNVLNHPIYGLPSSGIVASGNNTPATITTTFSVQRVMQFALKMHF
jgi:hypothetical protein